MWSRHVYVCDFSRPSRHGKSNQTEVYMAQASWNTLHSSEDGLIAEKVCSSDQTGFSTFTIQHF